MRVPAAEHLINQRVDALGRALPAAVRGDVGSLHKARVATRRLRAALPIIVQGRKAEHLSRLVRRLTQVLGPVRELDVSLLILDELEAAGEVPRPAIERLRAAIGDERRLLHADLARRLEGFNLDKLRKHALAAAREGDERTRRQTRNPERAADARACAGRRAERLALAIDAAAGLYLPDRLHRVRIAVKKLRYTLELEQSFSGSRATARIRTLRAAQDLLGRMHDLEVLIARARNIQSSPGASTLQVSADLDRLVRRLETECRQLHGHYMASRRGVVSLCRRLTARDVGARARTSAA